MDRDCKGLWLPVRRKEKGILMRKNYIRLFFSIISIVIIVMIAEILVFVVSSVIIDKKWKERIFEQYMISFSNRVAEMGNEMTSYDLFASLMEMAPDRISGVILRDKDGHVVLSMGRTSRGEYIPQVTRDTVSGSEFRTDSMRVPDEFSISVNSSQNVERESVQKPQVVFEATTYRDGRDIMIQNIDIRPSGLEGKEIIELPEGMSESEIAGTIMFVEDGNVTGFLDIVVFDLNFYGPTNLLIHLISFVFILFLPVALLFTLISGYIVSKNSSKSINEVNNALSSLANGEYDVHLDYNMLKSDESMEIAKSISSLARDLSRHSQSRREWFKNISHDLNTPVTGMNLLLSGAEDGVFPIDRNLIESVKKENDTLMSRISSVSFYSTLQDRGKDMKKRNIDVLELADSLLSGRSIVQFSAEDGLSFDGDYALSERAIKEVLDNAETYRKGGSVRWVVTKEGNFVVMRISNDGKLPSPRPQFFEPWARGDSSRHEGGSGLGLPICYQIMNLHGGDVSIDENGNTVTVTLRFPL